MYVKLLLYSVSVDWGWIAWELLVMVGEVDVLVRMRRSVVNGNYLLWGYLIFIRILENILSENLDGNSTSSENYNYPRIRQ